MERLAVASIAFAIAAIAFLMLQRQKKREAQRAERAEMWKEAQFKHMVSLLGSRKGLEATVAAIWYVREVLKCSLRDAVALAAPEHLERFDGKPDREPTATEVQRTFNEWARVIRAAQIGSPAKSGKE